jgi:glucan 1,3-beta-glucosidase
VSLAILGDIACSSMSLRRERLANPWKGVNFGGWLLLEPGPSHPLFSQHTLPGGHEARCEWDFLVALQQAKGKAYAAEVVRKHRETHTTKTDFEKARACGINAIRLPIGYWILLGPREGDPYVGPAIDFVDKAVDWAEACGLQIVLDLHGCPGGESGEAPCGRRQRPDGTWHWRDWDFAQSLKALDVLASRYHSRKCVTGVAVCNEPSNEVPARTLCRYYDKAINKVRNAGMPASRVAVILPCFQRLEGEDKFIECFHGMFGNKHRNICFDVHCYHCFENGYNGMSLAAHMRAIGENADMLRKHPIVVGEWSLALGCAAWQTCGDMQQNTVYRPFAAAQMEAFKESTHGSFFWNWAERDGVEWNYQAASAEGFFSGPPPVWPAWNGRGEDPLEQLLHPSPSEAEISWGETVCLRVFHGRYIDAPNTSVQARWPDKGDWQEFSFQPVADVNKKDRRSIRNGDLVRLQTHCGNYLSVNDTQVSAARRIKGVASDFVLHIRDAPVLTHRAIVYLTSRATSRVVNADEDDEGLYVMRKHHGWYQQLAVEKPYKEQENPKKTAKLAKRRSPLEVFQTTPAKLKKKRSLLETSHDETPAKLCAPKPSPTKLTPPKATPKKAGSIKRKLFTSSPHDKTRKSFSIANLAGTPAKILKMH